MLEVHFSFHIHILLARDSDCAWNNLAASAVARILLLPAVSPAPLKGKQQTLKLR